MPFVHFYGAAFFFRCHPYMAYSRKSLIWTSVIQTHRLSKRVFSKAISTISGYFCRCEVGFSCSNSWYWVFQGSLFPLYSSWRHNNFYGQSRLRNKGQSNSQWVPLAYRMKWKPSNGLWLCTFEHLLHTQCPVVHFQTQDLHHTWWQLHISSSAPWQPLQLTPRIASVTWSNIIWTPSVVLQLSKHFSYPNTLWFQHVQISDLLLYYCMPWWNINVNDESVVYREDCGSSNQGPLVQFPVAACYSLSCHSPHKVFLFPRCSEAEH